MTLKLKNTNFINIKAISINNIDINKIVVSNKLPFSKHDFKYFIGYKNDKKNYTFMHIPSKKKYI